MTHSQDVAALSPEAKIYYRDTVSRAADSIDARSQTQTIMDKMADRSFPRHLLPAARLALSKLKSKFDPGYAKTFDTDAKVLEQREFVEHKKQMQAEVWNRRDKGREKEADALQASLNAMVAPQDRAESDAAEFSERQRGYYKRDKGRADALFKVKRSEGIEATMANKLLERGAAELVWDKKYSVETREFCDRQCNVMEPS